MVEEVQKLEWNQKTSEDFLDILAFVDGDIVQAATAVQKELLTGAGERPMGGSELKTVARVQTAMDVSRFDSFVGRPSRTTVQKNRVAVGSEEVSSPAKTLESVKLGSVEVPRMFMGLWQFSSPSWGTSSRSKIDRHFRKHVDAGLVAYDMADHYGDAEVTFMSLMLLSYDYELTR